MNIFGMILIIIIGLCLWGGFRRGLFRSLLITAAMILSMAGAAYATPVVGQWIQGHTQIDERIEAYVTEKLQLDPLREDGKTAQMQMIEELPFPEGMKMAVINNNNIETYLAFQVRSFQAYLAHYLACVAVNSLSFILIQLGIIIISAVLLHISRDMTEIPIFHGIDKTGGLLLGAVQALTIVWSVFVLLGAIGNTAVGLWAYSGICDSPVLSFLYNHNLLLNTITSMTKLLF